MSEPEGISPAAERAAFRSRSWTFLKIAGFLIGVMLLAGALWMVWHQRATIGDALESARNPAWWQVVAMCLAVAANVVLTALLFSMLMARYGRVSLLEMQAIIASATLINFLPLRPGLIGRIAYHKAVHGIRAIDSGRTIIEASVISAVLGGWLIVAALASRFGDIDIRISALVPLPVLIILMCTRAQRRLAGASLVRYFEIFIWALRYWIAFEVIDYSIDASTALALACVSMITSMTPFVSNGLGLREWAIGLLAPVMATSAITLELGVTAELINRAAEVAVVLVLGLIGTAVLLPRLRRMTRSS